MEHFDLFVIGTGPAGQRAAIQAAKLGKKVGMCDRRELVGGVCINTGTIPSKTFREAVLYLTGLRQRSIYGRSYTVKEEITMEDLLFRCQHVIRREVEVIRDQLSRNGITLLGGMASFVDSHTLIIKGQEGKTEIGADHVVIATGTAPSQPEEVDVDQETVITSDMIMSIKRIPQTMTVVGAGVIGTEYASILPPWEWR